MKRNREDDFKATFFYSRKTKVSYALISFYEAKKHETKYLTIQHLKKLGKN